MENLDYHLYNTHQMISIVGFKYDVFITFWDKLGNISTMQLSWHSLVINYSPFETLIIRRVTYRIRQNFRGGKLSRFFSQSRKFSP